MHSSMRRRTVVTAVSAVSPVLLAAGCGSGDSGPGDATDGGGRDVRLQPVAAPGPDPFTRSAAKTTAPLPTTDDSTPTHTENASASASARGVQRVSGGTPELYGGTRSVSGYGVEQQIRHLTGPVPSGCPAPGDNPALRPPSAPGTAPERDTGTESGPDGG